MPYHTQYHHHHHHPYLSTTLSVHIITFLISLNPSFTRAQSSSNKAYDGSPLPTTAIIIIAVVFGVGITVCYVRHLIACIRGYLFGLSPNGGGGTRRRHTARGLDPAVIATFPTFSFSDVKLHLTAKTTPLECAICIYEFVDQDLLRLLPTCNHVFHPQCIAPWFSSHNTCPVCRANLEIPPDSQTPSESLSHVLQRQRSAGSSDHQSEPSDEEQIAQPHHHGDDHHRAEVTLQMGGEAPDHRTKSQPGAYRSNNKGVGKRFQRSHSTGHSLGENCERFTLRLPAEVRNKLVNQNVNNNNNNNNINNNTSNVNGLASLVSPRFRYRAWSVSGSASMSIKPEWWRFTMSPPYISWSGSSPELAGSSSNNNNNNNLIGIMRSPKSLFKSAKSPVAGKSQMNRVVRCDDIGERSSDKLWPDRTSQELGGVQDH